MIMGFLDFLKQKPHRGVREDLPPEVREVVDALREVKDPETELDVVDEGLVYGVTVEGKKVMAWFFLARSTPECHFCQAIAINAQRRILKDTIKVLRAKGFNRIEIYNEIGLLLEKWGDIV